MLDEIVKGKSKNARLDALVFPNRRDFRIWFIQLLDAKNEQLRNVQVIQQDGNGVIQSKIYGQNATYDGSRKVWIFYNGKIAYMDPQGNVTQRRIFRSKRGERLERNSMAALECFAQGQIHDGAATGALPERERRFSGSQSCRVQDPDVVSVRVAMECFGRRVCGESALHRFFSSGSAGWNSGRPLSVYRLILIQQRFPRAWARLQDFAAYRGVDSGCGVSSCSDLFCFIFVPPTGRFLLRGRRRKSGGAVQESGVGSQNELIALPAMKIVASQVKGSSESSSLQTASPQNLQLLNSCSFRVLTPDS